MKRLLSLACLLPILCGWALAEVPRKPVPSKYRSLWTDSPFTTKPVITSGPVYNPLEDYVLLGVSPIDGGYRVTMMNRKKPAEIPLIVESGSQTAGFEILEVLREEGDPMGTRVRMKRGTSTGTVAFEEKFLVLKAAPAPARKPKPASRTNPETQQQESNNRPAPHVPRRRIIPPTPPTSGAQNNNSSNNNRGGQNTSNRGRPPGLPNR